tara:strand:- start:2073 stop:2648 length:576 start_codon:yes stop_codon:yes gene_type:complete
MNNESLLKKEFKEGDVQRVRNLVNKDFTSKTKLQTGYQKAHIARKEGDIWEENGRQWTIKNGLKQNVTKLDAAKKALQVPLRCPKCKGSMEHHLAKKMYKIHGFCFDCTINYEADLKKLGLYDQYEKRMMTGTIKSFIKDLQDWALDLAIENDTYVTEHGDIESWKSNSDQKKKILTNVKEYIGYLSVHIE